MVTEITNDMLFALRADVISKMSEKRAVHTVAVESMASKLGKIYAPDKINVLRAAALLHDITKEKKTSEQLDLCRKYGINVSENDTLAPKTFHARTAAEMIKDKYPEFACEEIVSAVRWHTTGHVGMTLTEKIIYLSDYIDESRQFEDCVYLRNRFWNADISGMNEQERMSHLNNVLIESYNLTIKNLLDENLPVASDTFDARNELICEKLNANTLKG